MMRMIDAVIRDVRHAVRSLVRSPGYALVFVATLGLGIGANTAMFSAVNAVLLQPLPHEDGERLVYLRHSARLIGMENVLFSVPEIADYRQAVPSLSAVAEFSTMTFTMLGHETPRRVDTGIVTGNFFQVMGLSAQLGRTLGPEDDGEAAASVVVLSDQYWRSTFGADPDIIGKTVEINGRASTFVGVAQPAPPYPEATDIYVNMVTSPHHLDASMAHDRDHRMTEVFARLAPGASVETARAEVAGVTARLHSDHAEAYDPGAGYEVSVTPLKTQLTARAAPTLLILLATAGLVLVIACANLANLTLTRVLRRHHELTIRVSLGGSRAALRRELLMESLALAGLGAALGVVMASVGLDLLVGFTGRFTSRASEITLDGSVFAFTLVAAVAASLFFTIVPPLPDGDGVGGVLTRSGTRTTAGSGTKRAQRALVVAQIGTSFVLLMGAGLLLRTMHHLSRIDPGFDTDQVLSMGIPVGATGLTDAEIRTRYLEILDDVRAVPGVTGAALTSTIPLSRGGFVMFMEMAVEGYEPPPGAPHPRADFRVVSEGYFEAMGIRLLRGRGFQTTDDVGAAKVVVINESMARAYFGDRDPIGQRIAWSDPLFRFLGLGNEPRTVVGVAADTRDAGLDAAIRHIMYTPYPHVAAQATENLVVRVSDDPAAVLPALREVILAHDRNQPISDVATIADLSAASVATRRLNATLLGAFALVALIIAAVGIGGVLAFSVGNRTREFGVRTALGAARHQVWSGVLAEGAALAGVGVALGVVGAIALTRFIASLLVGVPALDPLTFVVVGSLLAGVAILASWIPAWRAATVSPLEALGSD